MRESLRYGIPKMTKRVRLTWSQKHAILRKCKELGVSGGVNGVKQVKTWAASELKLGNVPSYRTVLRILRDEDTIMSRKNSKGVVRKVKGALQKQCSR